MTGGYIPAGFHEVIYTDKTYDAYLKAKEEKRILWRVSSTLFSHIRHDVDLAPLDKFATKVKFKKHKRYLTNNLLL